MQTVARHKERGVALFFSIFALLLLTAIGAALIFMASTETSINSNFRQEQMAYFAAKAGIEEARARMMTSDPASIACLPGTAPCASPVVGNATYPLFDSTQVIETNTPSNSNHMIYYIVNPGSSAAVQPWDTNSQDPYADNELCHDGYTGLGLTVVPPDVRCDPATLPAGTGWYNSYSSSLPFNGTAAALPYKWVRIAPKLNGSIDYLTGAAPTFSTLTYSVNPNPTVSVNGNAVSIDATTPICWDGHEEVPLTATTVAPIITKCSQMTSSAVGFAGAYMTNVYVVTSLGVSSDATNAARKVVQADVALQPTAPFPYGLYATSTACPAITFTGTNPQTDSYTTANNGTYATTKSNTGGDIGSNGGVNVQNGNIGGVVGVLQPPPTGNGTCASPISINPGGAMVGTTTCPTGDNSNPPASCYLPAPYTFQTPPPPSPLPPVTNYTPPNCAGGKKSGQCMVPGSYGNITVNGTLYLAPGIYNVNSVSMQGNGAIIVNPPGAITLNVAGCANSTCSSTLGNPLSIAGNGITDDTIANDFTINYAGSGTVSIAGNGNVTAILNAPNAPVTQSGNGAWFGSILSSTASIGGNAFFHYDKNAALAPNNNGYYTLIGYRQVPY